MEEDFASQEFAGWCTKHQDALMGSLLLVPSQKNTVGWMFDSSEQYCAPGQSYEDNCNRHWEVRRY